MGLFGRINHQRLCHGFKDFGDFGGDEFLNLGGIDFFVETGARQFCAQFCRRGDTQIGCDQQIFEFFKRIIIQTALGEDICNPGGQFRGGAFQPVFQSGKPAFFPLFTHPASSAFNFPSSTPMTLAFAIVPGSITRSSVTGAKCSVCPVFSFSTNTFSVRPMRDFRKLFN